MRFGTASLVLLTAALPALAEKTIQEDPTATRLLAEARAARATWKHFPGFTADLTVNQGGKVARGTVRVPADGKVEVELADPAAREWARRTLRSTVGHRLDEAPSQKTPCAFADDNLHHPLGRAIRVLSDEFHSSYRIRGRQVLVVNRLVKEQGIRFTITVLEDQRTPEDKFLPVCFVVNSWNVKTGALQSAEAHHQTWKRVGGFDLPESLTVVVSTAGKQEVRRLRLGNFKLLAERRAAAERR